MSDFVIPDVPLALRADKEGFTLSRYVIELLERELQKSEFSIEEIPDGTKK